MKVIKADLGLEIGVVELNYSDVKEVWYDENNEIETIKLNNGKSYYISTNYFTNKEFIRKDTKDFGIYGLFWFDVYKPI